MGQKDMSLWNFMIRAHVRQGQHSEAHQLFEQLQQEGVMPDKFIFINVLSACASQAALSQGKKVHAHISATDLEADVVVGTALVNMYGKCGSLENAQRVFDKMHARDVISWNVIISKYAQNSQQKGALGIFYRMQEEGILPDKVTFVSILSACASLAALVEGKEVHAYVVGVRLVDLLVENALISMYGKCGNVEDAWRTFREMSKRDVISWNAMIAVYAQHAQHKDAFQIFHQMEQEGLNPNNVTFINILPACNNQTMLTEGKQLHACIIGHGLENDAGVRNSIVQMYDRCGSLKDALTLFNNMAERDLVLWNVIITAYIKNEQCKNAIHLFDRMQQEAIAPNKFIFVSIFSACAGQAALPEGKRMHACIVCSRIESDIVVGNAVLSMYSKCSSLEDAQGIFDRMADRDVHLWNALIGAYAQNGQAKEGLQLLNQMQWEGVMPDRVTFISIVPACACLGVLSECKWMHAIILCNGFSSDVGVANALVSMYTKCSSVDDALEIFEKMHQRDVISWNAMIAGYASNGKSKSAFQFCDQMLQEGILPDKVTFISILDACASITDLARGMRMCACITDPATRYLLDVAVLNAILTMYGKCGSLKHAKKVFDGMPERTVSSWNAMLSAYAQSGKGKDALQLFGHMLEHGLVPNKISSVSILSACSHAGLVDNAHDHFESMQTGNVVAWNVDHCNCMIDLLARAGMLNEAEDLINNMPFQPTRMSWTALLSACRDQVDVKQGERAAKHMFELDLEDAAPYVTLANILTAVGRLDDAANVMARNRLTLEEQLDCISV